MKASITNFIAPTDRSGRRSLRPASPRKVRVYRDSPASVLADEWFHRNQIYSLDFKCKAWGLITRAANKLDGAAISSAFKQPVETTRFDHKCGCSCGCSPGFRVNFEQPIDVDQRGEYWMKLEFSDAELQPLRDAIDKADKVLAEELAQH